MTATSRTVLLLETAFTGGSISNGPEAGYLTPAAWGLPSSALNPYWYGIADRYGATGGGFYCMRIHGTTRRVGFAQCRSHRQQLAG